MAGTKKTLNLALQGGGALGAYTWGVLDRLLEVEELSIEGISGTSAGAMNAAIMASGYLTNGRAGAKASLEEFWKRVSEVAAFSPLSKTPIEKMLTGWNLTLSPAYHVMDMLSRIFSPYVLNPLNLNPLRYILEDMIDTEALCKDSKMKLFITATHVESGQARIFHSHEVTHDVLLASACLPFMSQAVQVDGEYYWDGGYTGNPAIWPLIYHCRSEDTLLVQINPIHNNKLPTSADEIIDRLNEITFNSSLIAEMRAIDFVSKLVHQGKLDDRRYKDMKIHLIYSSDTMHDLNASSKMNADWKFFLYLKKLGRDATERWLHKYWKDVGIKSTVNIHDKFLRGAPHQIHAPQHPLHEKEAAAAANKKPAPKKKKPVAVKKKAAAVKKKAAPRKKPLRQKAKPQKKKK